MNDDGRDGADQYDIHHAEAIHYAALVFRHGQAERHAYDCSYKPTYKVKHQGILYFLAQNGSDRHILIERNTPSEVAME